MFYFVLDVNLEERNMLYFVFDFLNSFLIMLQVEDLMHVDLPSQKPAISAVKILTTLGVTVAGLAIISGIYLSTKR